MIDVAGGQAAAPTFSEQAVRIARALEEGYSGIPMSRGDRAELRRMRGDVAFPPEAFWRVVGTFNITPGEEPFWRDVIPLMVEHAHKGSVAPGLAAARAGVSPARVERWLRRPAEDARKEARRLLSKVDDGLHWGWFASLLRFWTDEGRTRFARDYFLSPEYRNRTRQHKAEESA
ncbi:MAG: type I-E CRISPR-associated protein Cse2/CasB [Gemmatimonadota bacterium]